MKHFLTTFIFWVLSMIAFSQSKSVDISKLYDLPVHSRGDLSFSASANILLNTPNGVQLVGGFKMRIFMTKRISFDSDILFGRDYIHAGPGIFGIPLWIIYLGSSGNSEESETSLSNLLFYALVMVTSAEHTSFHFPVRKSFDISPYFSLLRYRSSYEYGRYSNTNMTNEQFCFATGLELNKYCKRLLLSPYIEYSMGYANHVPGINAGIYCGIYFLNQTRKQYKNL